VGTLLASSEMMDVHCWKVLGSDQRGDCENATPEFGQLTIIQERHPQVRILGFVVPVLPVHVMPKSTPMMRDGLWL
jgi:hypothetical protein